MTAVHRKRAADAVADGASCPPVARPGLPLVGRPLDPSRPVAQLAGARLGFRGRTVLDGVDLGLEAGSIYVLLGPNGAGKTTLLRVLAGRVALDGGHTSVFGRDPRTDVAARRQIGVVPQTIALYPKLTVRENLEVFAAFARRPDGPALPMIDDVLRTVRAEAVAERLVGTLSGGYQRRANIGAALVADPPLLLMDEPTVGLDAEAASVLAEIIVALRDRGTAVLLTTHDRPVAAAVADRVGWLSGGRLVAGGRPADLIGEAFGGRVKIDLALVLQGTGPRLPGDLSRLAAELSGLGLVPGRDGRWRAEPGGIEREAVARLLGALATAGQEVRELRIEEQGFDDLCDHLAARDPYKGGATSEASA